MKNIFEHGEGIGVSLFTVLEPRKTRAQDITEEHYQALDRDGVIVLAKQLQSGLIKLLAEATDNSRLTSLLVHERPDDDPDGLKTTKIKNLPLTLKEEVSIEVEIVRLTGHTITFKTSDSTSSKKTIKIDTPKNNSWMGVAIAVGQKIHIILTQNTRYKTYGLEFLDYAKTEDINLTDDIVDHIIAEELLDTPEALSEIHLTTDMPNTDKKAQIKHPNKTTSTWNKWTPELVDALERSVEKGRNIDELFEEAQKHGLNFTWNGIRSQLNGMGYSIIKGMPIKKVVELNHE